MLKRKTRKKISFLTLLFFFVAIVLSVFFIVNFAYHVCHVPHHNCHTCLLLDVSVDFLNMIGTVVVIFLVFIILKSVLSSEPLFTTLFLSRVTPTSLKVKLLN